MEFLKENSLEGSNMRANLMLIAIFNKGRHYKLLSGINIYMCTIESQKLNHVVNGSMFKLKYQSW